MNLEQIRADTPAAQNQSFLLSAGASLMPNPVVDAVIDHIRLEQQIGGYAAADQNQDRLDGVHAQIAALLNAQPEEIALVENATTAWQRAFYAFDWKPGDRVITGRCEYAANYVAYLQMAERCGIIIDVAPNDAYGAIDVDALKLMIDDRVKLISVTWVPTNGGLTNPAARIGALARAAGVPYLLDACQAVGQMPVDVQSLNCDILTGTGRKFLRGPRGTGFLYVRKSLLHQLQPAMIDHFAAPWTSTKTYTLRPDARRFETWESSSADRLGLGAAAEYALGVGLDFIQHRCASLAGHLREGFKTLNNVTVHDLGQSPCAIVSFSVADHAVRSVLDRAAQAKIVIGASPPASTRLDSEARGLSYILRASPHYFNVEADVNSLLEFCHQLQT